MSAVQLTSIAANSAAHNQITAVITPAPIHPITTALLQSLTNTPNRFLHSFIAALSAIIVSELGDKTFFIAAILSMQHSRTAVYSGAMVALTSMTVLSVLLGAVTQRLIAPQYTRLLAAILFLGFGLHMIVQAFRMRANEAQHEYRLVESDLGHDLPVSADARVDSRCRWLHTVGGVGARCVCAWLSPVFLQALSMTALAEWGDRSQVATILLASHEHMLGVTLGAVLGHGLCTGLAVIAGKFVSKHISARTVTLAGGVLFILFALSSIFVTSAAF